MALISLPLVAAAVLALGALPDRVNIPSPDECVVRVEQARGAAGQPPLDRSPAVPGKGYLIAAVDKRIDGCAVMQLHGNVNDLLPLPQPTPGPARMMPAR